MRSWFCFSAFLLVFCGASAAGTDTPTVFLSKHQVWLEKGLAWESPDGDPDPNERYAIGRVLYFGRDRKFGMFQMNIVRNGKGIGLDEGDGGRIFSGEWKSESGNIKIRYRLIDAYKLLLPEDKQPEVPGPVEEREISLANLRAGAPEFEFDGKWYLPNAAIKVSSLREFLRAYAKEQGK